MAHATGSSTERRLRCTLVTPDRPVHDGEADFVVVPGPDDGEVGILPGHAPYMAILGYGVMRVTESPGHVLRFAVYGGFVQVVRDQVTVLASRAQLTSEITKEHLDIDRKEVDAIRALDDESYRKKITKMREAQARLRAARPAEVGASHE